MPRQRTSKSRRADGPILVLSAFAPELAALRQRMRRAPLRGLSTADRWILEPVGIGLVEAAAGASRAIATHAPRLIVFTGTAGTYSARALPVGDVVVATDLVLVSTAVLRGDGYLPGPMPTRLTATASIPGSHAHALTVANPLAITKTAALSRRIARATGAAAENLEVFAVGRAAIRAQIPFAAVLGIANQVGPNAHAEWLKHQTAATEAAGAVIATFLTEQFHRSWS